jgi:hypothetical protein
MPGTTTIERLRANAEKSYTANIAESKCWQYDVELLAAHTCILPDHG